MRVSQGFLLLLGHLFSYGETEKHYYVCRMAMLMKPDGVSRFAKQHVVFVN